MKRDRGRFFEPSLALVARVRLVQVRMARLMLVPGKLAAVDDRAADRGTVPADVFCRRIDDYRSAVVEGPDRQRGRRVVDDQRNAEALADLGDLGDRKDLELRIRQGLGIIGTCPVVRRPGKRLGISRIDETNLDAETFQGGGKQRPGAAIKAGGADDVVAGARKVQEREG